MSRRTTRHTPSSKAPSGDRGPSLLSFVVHSINRLRGKPNTDYQDAIYQPKTIEIRNPWRAVEIVSDSRSCTASKQLKNKRFLCDEAPILPLPGCTSINCSCRYKHFSDRRKGPRRGDELGVRISGNIQSDRRLNRGRRSTDG